MIIRTIANWLFVKDGTYAIRKHGIVNLREHRDAILGWGYVVIALITFGYNAANHPSCSIAWRPEDVPTRSSVETGTKSAIGAAVWPAYWVWELSDKMVGRAEPAKC